MLAAAVCLVHGAWAAGPCEQGRERTGLGLAPVAGGLAVAAVDAGSPAGSGGARVGDEVLQANGAVLHTCADYARAIGDAQRERKALLLLVRRVGAELPLALGAATWERTVATPAPPAAPPSVREITLAPAPPPLPPESRPTIEGVIRGLETLSGAPRRTAPADYRRGVARLGREIDALGARGAAPADVVTGLRTVLRYYEAAGVAWTAEEALREREHRPRHIPLPEAATAPYFADSEAAAVIDEFPFLRPLVVRDPSPSLLAGESAGLWRPVPARSLLWERGREELERLTEWMGRAAR